MNINSPLLSYRIPYSTDWRGRFLRWDSLGDANAVPITKPSPFGHGQANDALNTWRLVATGGRFSDAANPLFRD